MGLTFNRPIDRASVEENLGILERYVELMNSNKTSNFSVYDNDYHYFL